MYGVPADLDLSGFVGAMLEQICLGEWQLQFHFHPDGIFSIEGHWELASSDGTAIDSAMDHSIRDAYRVHVLLGHSIARCTLDPPRSLSLHFETGHVLTFFDDSEHYETISISPGNIYI
jgi:hypothetical protein